MPLSVCYWLEKLIDCFLFAFSFCPLKGFLYSVHDYSDNIWRRRIVIWINMFAFPWVKKKNQQQKNEDEKILSWLYKDSAVLD